MHVETAANLSIPHIAILSNLVLTFMVGLGNEPPFRSDCTHEPRQTNVLTYLSNMLAYVNMKTSAEYL